MRGDNGFGVVRATEMSKIYHSITKKIKANCDYSEIINYKGSDFVVYTCSNRKYGFAIGTSGNGIVRYFPDGVTDE